MQDKIQALLPVNGNQYFTPCGFYSCKVTASELQGGTIKVKVVLISENDGSQPSRVYKITGTWQTFKKEALSLVTDIHKWAQLDRDTAVYWINKVKL